MFSIGRRFYRRTAPFYPRQLAVVLLLASSLLLGACHSTFSRGPAFGEPRYLGDGKEWRMYPVLADFNSDGKLDIVATHRRPLHENSLHIFLGAGDGSFNEMSQTWSSPGYAGVGLGDINGDGRNDLIAASHFNRIQTYISEGEGKFKESVTPSPDGYVAAHLADLNHDGTMEAILLGNEKAGVEILKPGSQGGWILKTAMLQGQIGRDLKIADMNNDGLLDLVVSMARGGVTNSGVVIFLQDQAGGWKAAPDTNFYSATKEFHSLAVGDLNGDGLPDIALNGGYADLFKPNGPDVYLADGKGGWMASSEGLKVAKNPAEGIAIGDFNGDGFADLIAGGNVTGKLDDRAYGLLMFAGDGKGKWRLVKNSGLPDRGMARAYGMSTADLNGDNAADLVVVHGAPEEGVGYLSVWTGKQPKK